jgi:hypothetical protein
MHPRDGRDDHAASDGEAEGDEQVAPAHLGAKQRLNDRCRGGREVLGLSAKGSEVRGCEGLKATARRARVLVDGPGFLSGVGRLDDGELLRVGHGVSPGYRPDGGIFRGGSLAGAAVFLGGGKTGSTGSGWNRPGSVPFVSLGSGGFGGFEGS